jgi:hypothetical protein
VAADGNFPRPPSLRIWSCSCRKLLGSSWRDGLMCDRAFCSASGTADAHLGQAAGPRKEARRWVLARQSTSTKASSRSRA